MIFLAGLRGGPIIGMSWEEGLGRPLLGQKARNGRQMGRAGGKEGMASRPCLPAHTFCPSFCVLPSLIMLCHLWVLPTTLCVLRFRPLVTPHVPHFPHHPPHLLSVHLAGWTQENRRVQCDKRSSCLRTPALSKSQLHLPPSSSSGTP